MKYYWIIFVSILPACSSLMHYQEQPVVELTEKTFKTYCNGIAEAWDSCFRKANQQCNNSYDVIEKIQSNDFVHREITFRCN